MKNFGNLIKNELIKTGKTVYFKVFVVLILVASILFPTGFFISDKLSDKNDDISWEVEWYEYAQTAVEKAYYGCYKESQEFFDSNNIKHDSWKYTDYYDVYASLYCARVKVFDMLSKGEASYEEAQSYFYDALNGTYSNNDNISYGELNSITPGIIHTDSETTYEDLSSEDYAKLRDAALKDKETMANYIKTANIQTKYTKLIESYSASLTELKKDIAEAEEQYKKTKSPDDKRMLVSFQTSNETNSVLLWGYQQLKTKNLDENSWQYDLVTNNLVMACRKYQNSYVQDKDVFEASDDLEYYKTYKRYCLSFEPNFKAAQNAITGIKYAIENDVPIADGTYNGAFNKLTTQMKFVSVFICLFMIVIAGTTLTNEFTSGSIRLLLIRPRSRSKILLSKILMVFIYGSCFMLASLIIMSALNMGFCETKDLFAKTVTVSLSGKAYTTLPILLMLLKCVLSLFSINLMISFSILLSVLFSKGGVLAVALANMIQVAGVCVTELLSEVNIALNGFLEYTPVPYLDMSQFIASPLDGVGLGAYYYSAPIQNVFSPIIGAVIVTVFSAVMYAIAFAVFRKKQIKN